MNVIIPAAGAGTRLIPYTLNRPKPLVCVNGQPILGRILDKIQKIDYNKIVIVVGYKKEKIIEYIKTNYGNLDIEFVEQKQKFGLEHAIWCAKKYFTEDTLITVSDVIIQTYDFDRSNNTLFVGYSYTPENYGTIINDKIVEKPKNSQSNLVLTGQYYFKDGEFINRLNKMLKTGIMPLANILNEMKYKLHHVNWWDFGNFDEFHKNYLSV